ncbi:unnamed protein product [Trifolium pratense]|uniref:Uncharacterized protein n=1 Tax=Trifolium pratense TaxID=57577 RepID=A0ACB0INS6_TRIPR|nr:unnamed protein product [Trifolium pratense]
MKLQLLVLVLVFLMASATSMEYYDCCEDCCGCWHPIEDINDTQVIEIANFIVTEINKQIGATLKFKKVIKGQSQDVAGTNYHLIISTTNFIPNVYDAVVYECPWEHVYDAVVYDCPWLHVRKLTKFVPVKHH